MTGYGKATVELPDKKINVEIKSLNSKAMDLSARIAPLYREKEMEIRNEISRKLERGKVDFSLWKKVVRNAMESDYSWRESAREYMELYKRLLKK